MKQSLEGGGFAWHGVRGADVLPVSHRYAVFVDVDEYMFTPQDTRPGFLGRLVRTVFANGSLAEVSCPTQHPWPLHLGKKKKRCAPLSSALR